MTKTPIRKLSDPVTSSSACVATEITFHLLRSVGVLLGGLGTVDVLVGALRAVDVRFCLRAVGVLVGGLRAVDVLVGGRRAVGALVGGLAGSSSRNILLDFDLEPGESFLDSSNRDARIFGNGRPVRL